MKVLIVQQKMIGDVLTSSILFEAIKNKYPNSELHYVINANTYPVVENNPFIDKFIFVTPQIESNKFRFFAFLKSIKKENYEIVIDVYGKITSNLIAFFSKAKTKISYHKPNTAFLYTNTLIRKKKAETQLSLAIENRLQLLEFIGVTNTPITPQIFLTEDEIENAKAFLKSSNLDLSIPIFMISALGSNESKTYPFNYMAKLLDFIVKEVPNCQILFNYIPPQKEKAKKIYNHCTSETQKNIYFELYTKSLREFLAVSYHCTAIIGNEGGAINMGKALNIPSFCVFSPHISKQNWFWKKENSKDMAIHISDFLDFSIQDKKKSKKFSEDYYLKMTPEHIVPSLGHFLKELNYGV